MRSIPTVSCWAGISGLQDAPLWFQRFYFCAQWLTHGSLVSTQLTWISLLFPVLRSCEYNTILVRRLQPLVFIVNRFWISNIRYVGSRSQIETWWNFVKFFQICNWNLHELIALPKHSNFGSLPTWWNFVKFLKLLTEISMKPVALSKNPNFGSQPTNLLHLTCMYCHQLLVLTWSGSYCFSEFTVLAPFVFLTIDKGNRR